MFDKYLTDRVMTCLFFLVVSLLGFFGKDGAAIGVGLGGGLLLAAKYLLNTF